MEFNVYSDKNNKVTLLFNDFIEESETGQDGSIVHVLKHERNALRFCYATHSADQHKVDLYVHKDCKTKNFYICGILKVSSLVDTTTLSMVVCMQVTMMHKTINFGKLSDTDNSQIYLLFEVSKRLNAIGNDVIVDELRDGYDDNEFANKISIPYGSNVESRKFVYNTDEDAESSFTENNTISLAFGIAGKSFDPVQTITVNGTKKHPGKIKSNEAHMKDMVTVEQCVQDESPSNSQIGKITITNPSKKRVLFLFVTHHDQDGKKTTHVYGLSNRHKMEIAPAELSTATKTLWESLDRSGLSYLRKNEPKNRCTYLPMRKQSLFAQVRGVLLNR